MSDRSEVDLVLHTTRALVGIAARSLGNVSAEVSLPQYRVLVLLETHQTLTMGELADLLGVSPSTVTRVCDVLVDKTLIRRRAAKDNGRVVCAVLTARGRALVDRVMSDRRRLVEAALERMSPSARRDLTRGLEAFDNAAGEVATDAWTLGWTMGASAS